MKRDVENATLTIDDLRKRLLTRSVDKRSKVPREEMYPDDNREIDSEFTQYILAGVCGVVVALLLIHITS